MTLIETLESREEALNVRQMAELLKVSERHIYELAANGSLPAFRVGKAIRFDPHDVADWLRRKKPPNRATGPERLKNEILKLSRGGQATPPAQVWRNKTRSLEVVLALDTSKDNPVKKS